MRGPSCNQRKYERPGMKNAWKGIRSYALSAMANFELEKLLIRTEHKPCKVQ